MNHTFLFLPLVFTEIDGSACAIVILACCVVCKLSVL